MQYAKQELSGWGRYPRLVCKLIRPASGHALAPVLLQLNSLAPRGLGRSYGDASLNQEGYVCETVWLNKFLKFQPETGILTCEAGVTLEEILKVFVPRGWFLPVTPGTKYITVGGAVAADVHGKNHHQDGSFVNFVVSLKLITASGELINCSRRQNSDLFWATFGGMGLTGLILEVTLKLKPIKTAYLKRRTLRVANLDELFAALEKYDQKYLYSAAWVDTLAKGRKLGRSVIFFGMHADLDELAPAQRSQPLEITLKKKRAVPFSLPSLALNRITMQAYNQYYWQKNKSGWQLVDYDEFFYPLDSLLNWNRLYGKRGFTQYQMVIPTNNAYQVIKKVLEKLNQVKQPSFLAVLKKMGPQQGLLSFPLAGYTLTLDFPISSQLAALLKELDKMVVEAGGRVYLAKDAFLDEQTFKSMYNGFWQKWLEVKAKYDPNCLFQSNLSRRVGLCP